MNAAENDDDNFLSEAPLGTTRPAVPHLFLVSPVLTSSAASFNSFRASIRRQVALSSGFRVGRPPEWSAEWNTWVKERRKRFWLAGFNVTQLKKKKKTCWGRRIEWMVVTCPLYPQHCVLLLCRLARKNPPRVFFFSLDVSPELCISYYLPPTSFRLFKISMIERQSLVCAGK